MAITACKGTVLKQDIASTLTAVAQVISIDISESTVETFETTSLDTSGAGKTFSQTGYADPGDVSFELFWDPALAGHQALTDDITTPAERDYQVVFADAATTELDFTAAGIGVGLTVAMNDGLKGNVTLKLTGLPTYPT